MNNFDQLFMDLPTFVKNKNPNLAVKRRDELAKVDRLLRKNEEPKFAFSKFSIKSRLLLPGAYQTPP